MKFITKREYVEKGCRYCVHCRFNGKGTPYICEYYDCPYEELDGYDTYDNYLKENGLDFYMKLV